MSDGLISELMKRIEVIEKHLNGHNWGDMANEIVRIRRAIDGDDSIRYVGLLERIERLTEAVNALKAAEKERADTLAGINLAIKVLAGATGAAALPQLWALVNALF